MLNHKRERLMKILDEISDAAELREIPGASEESARLRERLADDEFRIAVVGEFSSGKSTFINALLGQDVLQHAATETTAAVTRIVNVTQDDPRRMTGRVMTRQGKEIPMPNLKDLKEYTTTQSVRYPNRVPEEIASVEIYLPFMVLSRPVVLVDTPGLNGMAEGHREQTVALIQKAHACIYLIPRGGLGESDLLFLAYLAKFQKNFIFIQNFIDEFQEYQGDTVPKKLAEQRAILDQKVFAENADCVYEICGVSALMELASADQSIERLYADSPEPLTPEDRVRLHEQSGFEGFRQTMRQTFREDRMDEIQYGGTARAIANWIRSVLEHVSMREQQAREFFEASRDKRALEKLDRLRERMLAGEQRQRENLQNFVIARGEEIRREESDTLKTNLEDLDGQVAAEMGGIRNVPKMDQFEKNLPGLLENRVGTILEEGNIRLRQKFQTLYQVLLTKIDEYSGLKNAGEVKLDSLSINTPSVRRQSFAVAENRVEQQKTKLADKQQELSQLESEGVQINTELRRARQSEDSARRAQQEITRQRDRDISRMGSRPAAAEREERYTEKVYRGGLGFLDALFGPKTVTRYRTVRDDSAGEKWDRRRAEIQNAFASRNNALSGELASAKRRRSTLSAEQEKNQAKLRSVEDKIQQLERNIRLESEKLEMEKKNAAQEYIALRKDSLRKQVQVYLLGDAGVLTRARAGMAAAAEKTEQEFTALAMCRFTQARDQKLKWIEQTKQEKSPEILRQAEDLEGICQRLQKILLEVEGE